MKKIEELIQGKAGSYIFPFFWQHGEDETTLRDYMRAIYEANIRAVCVECRPHPDFCGPKWWQDMDIILDEAHKRGMQVWILDDDHFPTGHANGAIAKADKSLRPWYIDSVFADAYGPSPANRVDIADAIRQKVHPMPNPFLSPQPPKDFFEDDEEILSVTAWEIDDDGRMTNGRDISAFVVDGQLTWDVPNGSWRIYTVFATHNGQGRTDYINILDHDSVRVLVDEVYEKHFERYPEEFGKTIRGFFSDEPMVGNIAGMYQTSRLGNPDKRLTDPWQKDMPAMLEDRLGEDWARLLPLLWNDGEDTETARVRQAYMDAATRLIEKNFAGQLGAWCEAHGVEYIGHIWEDKHLSYAFGGGLGHYFRALHGNHMGGVDLVFNSQMHPWSNHSMRDAMGGDFYYYVLGKLASSHAHIDPHKKGRAMCEIFGATGWDFGVDKMKFLADNFLVSGINRFVPHAFSPKAFPDLDCPPHFYAHGENAQFTSFACLMGYLQRMCHLLDGGKAVPQAAILYNAENDWVGEMEGITDRMYCDVPAKILSEAQIDYDILPTDALEGALQDDLLVVNGYAYQALIVPASDYLSGAFLHFADEAEKQGFPVIFLEKRPQGVQGGTVVSCKDLIKKLREQGLGEISLSQPSPNLRYLHYRQDNDIYMIVNNDLGQPYEGVVTLPMTEKAFQYDAYANVVRPVEQTIRDGVSEIRVKIKAYEPLVLFFGEFSGTMVPEPVPEGKEQTLKGFMLSSCRAKDYPAYGEKVLMEPLQDIATICPDMMDCYRYETTFDLDAAGKTVLQADYVSDPCEVFVNGISCGRRIAPDWIFDLTDAVREGVNSLRIEVFATPARKVQNIFPPEGPVFSMGPAQAVRPEGILGEVRLYTE